jgi:integrase
LLFFFGVVLEKPLVNVDALRAKRKPTLRVAISRDATIGLLNGVPDLGGYGTKFIAKLIYGCGLRVTEPLNLRIKDVDVTRSALHLWETKGDKCRVVHVPCGLMRELQAQIELARAMWKLDVANGLPIALPHALARKYPSRVSAWQWYWVFPQRSPCRHPRTGELVRYRMHESNVQRAVRIAARKVGLEGVITPHNLRHCYGTHVAESGQNMRSLQMALGHRSLETTMGYVHSDGLSVRSPIEEGL